MILAIWRARSIAAALALSLVPLAPTAGFAAEPATAPDSSQSESDAKAQIDAPVVLPAVGGRDLLRAMESSKLSVVGRISGIEKIDLHGYAADLRVDKALNGPSKTGAILRIAWEELAPSRPVRFEDGDRVLVCLDPAPNYTLWTKRFGDKLADILAIARGGESFLRDPDGETVHLLGHYLALGKDGRDDPAALSYLVGLVAVAPEPLAIKVLEGLDARHDIASKLTPSVAMRLARAASDVGRPMSVRRGTLLLIGRAGIRDARPGIDPLSRSEGELRAEALHTIAKLDGGLPADLVEKMLVDKDGGVRAVAVHHLESDDEIELLVSLTNTDPSPQVRIAASHRLLEEHGAEILDDVITILGDEDTTVRMVAARDVAKLGEEIVPKLEELAESGSERDAEGVVLTFTMMGDVGGRALVRLHHDHASLKIRSLAGLALGYLPGTDVH